MPTRRRTQTDAALAERERLKLLGDVARDYWVQDRTQAEIAKTHRVNASTITRLLQQARAAGIIDVRIDEGLAIRGIRNDGLGKQLRDCYDLDDCIVMSVLLRENHDHEEDEYLHRALAWGAGERLQQVLDTGTHLCVSGGRAAYHTAEVFAHGRPMRKNVRITPLCGRVWTQSWQPKGRGIVRPLDADDVTVVLAKALAEEPGTVFSQVIYPLFAGDAKAAMAQMESHCRFHPGGTWRSGQVPDRAVVGVGGIHPGGTHRFIDLVRPSARASVGADQQTEELTPFLDDAARQIREAESFVAQHRLPFFGDVGNRLFAALPLPGDVAGDLLESMRENFVEVQRLLNAINARMVIANWDHLRAVPHVQVIAGGPWKLPVIWTLLITAFLHPGARIVNELCTDTDTATGLVNAFDAFERAPRRVRDWYEDVTRQIFS